MNAYSAVRWSAVSKYTALGLQLVISLVLARLLAPEYFGLLGMATVITGFVGVFKNFGFSSAIIQRQRLTCELLSTLFWVNLAVCLMAAGIVAGVAPLVSLLYGDPRVTPIVVVLSLNFALAGLTMIPLAMLTRQMTFNKLAVREIAGVAISGITALALALMGWGVWALVAGSLANSLSQVILLNLLFPFRPRLTFDRQGLKECLGFGLNLTGFNIFNYFTRNADNFIIGRFLGAGQLGFYAFAYGIYRKPQDAVTSIITGVLFPKLSRMQGGDSEIKRVFLRAVSAIAFVTFPMMFGFAAVAEPFVDLILGAKWLPAVVVLRILAPLGAVQSVFSSFGTLYLAKDRTDWMLRLGIASGTMHTFGFAIGARWDIFGVAAAYCITTLITLAIHMMCLSRLLDGFSRGFVRAIAPYFLCASVMVCIVLICQTSLRFAAVPQVYIVISSVFVGILAYSFLIVCVRPPVLADWIKILSPPVRRLRISLRANTADF